MRPSLKWLLVPLLSAAGLAPLPGVLEASGVVAEERRAAEPVRRVDPLLELLVGEKAPEAAAPEAKAGPKNYVVAFVEFVNPDAAAGFKKKAGAAALCRVGEFVLYLIERGDVTGVKALAEDVTVRWVDCGGTAYAPPPPEPGKTPGGSKGQPEPTARTHRGGLRGATGKGVVIAVIDTGVDFRSKEFLGAQGKTRLVCYWDTLGVDFTKEGGSKPPRMFPNGAPIGTLYEAEQLNAALAEGGNVLPDPDDESHGSGCAAIAAGKTGVAPGAQIVAVRIGNKKEGLRNAYLLPVVCEWLQERFKDRPLVISCSFGGHYNGHDGFDVQDKMLSAQFPPTARHRSICVAAGNEAFERLHAGFADLKEGDGKKLEWSNKDGKNALLNVYLDGAKPDQVKHEASDGVKLLHEFTNPVSGSVVYRFLVGTKKDGSLTFTTAAKSVRLDAYFPGEAAGHSFSTACARETGTVGSPASAAGVVTVGSYDFNDEVAVKDKKWTISVLDKDGKEAVMNIGDLSAYSSRGFLRTGDKGKPDVVAPGQWHTIPAVKATPEAYQIPESDLAIFNGTSAATPYTAGVIALMLETKNGLTAGEIKDLLRRHANRVGPKPNESWGHGKLDLKAVEALLEALSK
jgi:subtilisin family serine protease